MSGKSKNPGNILVDPAEYASQMEHLEPDQNGQAIERIENHLAHRLRLGGAITYINEEGDHVIEDRDGVSPFPAGSKFPTPPVSAELEIRELAFRHGVSGERTGFDDWCESISALAGDEIQSDEVELLLIGLRRIGHLDGIELTKLHARYLEEMLNP